MNLPIQKVKRERLSAEVRRKQLLDLAIIETANNGIGQARHADIASASGVAVSTVFFYFPTVDVLTNAVIDAVENTLLDILSHVHYVGDGDLSLDSFIGNYKFYLNKITKEKADYVTICLEWGNDSKSNFWPNYLYFRAKQIEKIANTFSRLQENNTILKSHNVETIAIMAMSLSRTVLSMKILDDTEDAINEVFKSFINYLQN